MKKESHILLAQHLLKEGRRCGYSFSPVFSFFFLLGNRLPDKNPFTYMRGLLQSRKMRGHDRAYSTPVRKRLIARLARRKGDCITDAYDLGALLHYLSDAFTFVHTRLFRGSMKLHQSYEKALHRMLLQRISTPTAIKVVTVEELVSRIQAALVAYEESPRSLLTDCNYILSVCGTVFFSFLRNFTEKGEQNYRK